MKRQLSIIILLLMSLKSNIQQFGLTGKNVVHYNLPASQQAALENILVLKATLLTS